MIYAPITPGPTLAIPRRTRTPHSDYQPGGRRDPRITGKINGFVSLREHQDHLHLTPHRPLDRDLALQIGYPVQEVDEYFGPEPATTS